MNQNGSTITIQKAQTIRKIYACSVHAASGAFFIREHYDTNKGCMRYRLIWCDSVPIEDEERGKVG
jgi:hypothetical protein